MFIFPSTNAFQQNITRFLSSHGLVGSDASQAAVADVLQNSGRVLEAIARPDETLDGTARRFRDVLEGDGLPPKILEARRRLTDDIDQDPSPLTSQTLRRAIEFVADNMLRGGILESCAAGRCENREILAIAESIRNAGGRALLVGGSVRDKLLGHAPKDFDVEVYGLTLERLERVLGGFGDVIAVGRSFGILRVKGIEADFSIPRRDSKVSPGHRGFQVTLDPQLSFDEASRRRDLTVNSMGWDPLTGEIFDPHGGRKDLELGILRPTDPQSFSEDPLRGLRVAQFAARLSMEPTPELLDLCARLDLSELPGERLRDEFRKMLLKSDRPSRGLEVLRRSGLLGFFPELAAMVDTPQDPIYHPEGNVWEHTLMVVDEAAKAKTGNDAEDLIGLFSALCHDLGKPVTTQVINGEIRSPSHSEEGVPPTETFLQRLRAPGDFITQVQTLVRYHLAPTLLVVGGAKPKAYRRLANALQGAGLNSHHLFRVGKSDHFGRTTEEALARSYPYGDRFLEEMVNLNLEHSAERDVVLGRDLVKHGLVPGPHFTPLLEKCREIQYETGWDDPKRILERALAPNPT